MKLLSNNKLFTACLYGVAFGLLDSLLMIPLEFENKTVAIAGAFLQRFTIGFLIPYISLPVSGVMRGIVISLLISLPTAVITGSYIPIFATGIIGGAIIGKLSQEK
ncbi:MAG: hypothetical protein WAU07_00545 [Microgenomates group bacterium]